MKIVQYLARVRIADGGVVRAVLDLCEVLATRGHEVTLLTVDPSDAPKSWLAGKPGHPRIDRIEQKLALLPRLSRASMEQARREIEQAGVVHLHVPWDPICLQLARLARQSGIPYVVSLHSMLDNWCMAQNGVKKRLFLALAGRRFLERAMAVHCTAQAERDQSSKWYTRGRPVVVPLIFGLLEYQDLPGPELARQKFCSALCDPNEPVVLYLSRLHPKKGLELLFEAAARLRDDGLALNLLIAGTGEPQYEQCLRQLVKQHQLSDRVAFLGFVSGREKVSLYQGADVFVLPTSQENWGFVLLEALAAATPVVTTRGVDIWSELQSSGGAVIVDSTPQAIAAAIVELLGDPGRRRVMAQKGRAWALEHLHVDRVAEQFEHLYGRVCRAAC